MVHMKTWNVNLIFIQEYNDFCAVSSQFENVVEKSRTYCI
jgi:hypothetical protein